MINLILPEYEYNMVVSFVQCFCDFVVVVPFFLNEFCFFFVFFPSMLQNTDS